MQTCALVREHGGTIIPDIPRPTSTPRRAQAGQAEALLADRPVRTIKFLYALCAGLPILTPAWLQVNVGKLSHAARAYMLALAVHQKLVTWQSHWSVCSSPGTQRGINTLWWQLVLAMVFACFSSMPPCVDRPVWWRAGRWRRSR